MRFPGWAVRARGLFADTKGPWGPSSGGPPPTQSPEEPASAPRPSSPWDNREPRQQRPNFGKIGGLEELLTRSRARFGGGGGGVGRGPDRSIFAWALLALVLLWLLFTSVHRIAPEERGVVTQFGRYNRTLSPGIGLTLPSPLERVQKVDV